ncbi:hypothetical protein PCANC_27724, partial [Puccinia coronata f. sp. avenae]
MVNIRRHKQTLQGPLPPPTRPKRPYQTKAYKALLALPPLPPSPVEPNYRHTTDHIDESDRPPSPFISPLSFIFSQYLTRNAPSSLVPESPLPSSSSNLKGKIPYRPPDNQYRDRSSSASSIPSASPSSLSSIDSPIQANLDSSELIIPQFDSLLMSQTIPSSDITPRAKFLQQPSIYKQDVEQLTADGSNFDRWKRGLTRIILLTLGHPNFFDKPDNYSKLSNQENTCLLFLIQITIHDELSSLVDQYTKGTDAYDAVQTNFQGTVQFRQMELVDKLLEFRVSGPSTEPSQIPGLFNKIFETFAGLHKVGAGLSPLVESLILQAVVPSPSSMSRSQLFQNISLQLGKKPDVTARDIQTIITLAYGESLRFDSSPSQN